MSQVTGDKAKSGHQHLHGICNENAIEQNCVKDSGHSSGGQASNVFKDTADRCNKESSLQGGRGRGDFPSLALSMKHGVPISSSLCWMA